MKRKELLKFIVEQKSTNFEEVYEFCAAFTKNAKKQVRRSLSDYFKHGTILYNSDTGEIKVPPRRPPKKKKNGHKSNTSQNNKPAPLKYSSDASKDFEQVVEKYKIRAHFPKAAIKEAKELADVSHDKSRSKRLDLRKKMIVTIDGADAKDLDDAVSVEKKKSGWKLGVHIADVAHYVKKDSALDAEAFKRGNSFYFINKVIPMFPVELSNNLCSLNSHENKLTLSIFIDMDKEGNIKGYDLKETVISTHQRLVYSEVEDFFNGKKSYNDPKLEKSLLEMRELFKILNDKRMNKGSINFDFKEQKITLDENDEPERVWLKDSLVAERIVEEYMLLANQCVAKYLSQKGPAIFRVHQEPSEEKMRDFGRVVMRFGYKIQGLPVPGPKELQLLLTKVANKPYKEMFNQILLRSMSQARYQTENAGHFGLAFEYYTHFTSPIRRYADLVTHRLIKRTLHKKKPSYTEEDLNDISEHISTTERVAMEAERDLYKIKAIRMMEKHVGETFDGRITGVSDFGMFVQILDFGVDGLVRFADLDDDYYIFREQDYSITGKRTKTKYTIGDSVVIKVKKVNVERGFLDLIIVKKTG